MKDQKQRLFLIDWMLHLMIGSIIPILSFISGTAPKYWIFGIVVYFLSIPLEGYILLLNDPNDKREQICLRAMYLDAMIHIVFLSGCCYLIMRWPIVDYRLYYSFFWLGSIAGTFKYRMSLSKYLGVVKK